MSTQRENDAESGKERFVPKPHEQGGDPDTSSLATVVSDDDDDRLDRLSRMAGTNTCDLCRERLPCRVLEHGLCRGCRE